MVSNIGQNLRDTINEVFRNFEKMNLEYKDKRSEGPIVQELKIFLSAGDQFVKLLIAKEEIISGIEDNQVAELERIFQNILMEVEARATNCMVECLGRFFTKFDQEF
jgi:hypothetical protein